MKSKINSSKAKGFTIVELMIATVVFTVILLVCLEAVTAVGRMLYKGITVSQNSEASRSAMDSVENDIRFTTSISKRADGAYCVGDHKYSFNSNIVTDDASRFSTGLVRQKAASFTQCMGATPLTGETVQLLGTGMTLSDFSISGCNTEDPSLATTLCTINIVVSTGEHTDIDNFNTKDASCHASSLLDTQFCAVNSLTTSVIIKGGL